MAIRKLRYEGDPVLGKVCKEVKEMTPHLKELVIDVGEGPYVFVNPKIVETAGEQIGDEGCLSVPGKSGTVRRPEYAKTVAFDADMNPIEVEGHGLFARAMCHEFDHLDGHLYLEKVEGPLNEVSYADEDEN